MTTNEMKLICMIHSSFDPEQALNVVEEIITKFLEPSQSSEATSPEYFRARS